MAVKIKHNTRTALELAVRVHDIKDLTTLLWCFVRSTANLMLAA